MFNKRFKIGIIIFITSLLISCGATPKNKLVGKWADAGQEKSGDYMEFLEDHTVVMHTKAVQTPLLGKWAIADGGSVKVDLTVAETTQSILFQFEDDQLSSTGPNGAKNKLVKL
ncbi:MAG TPA: hypothetical protein ENJ33_02435 [Thiothrix sp.]|nr:hypothetical protein [Thiothrix sp.]